MKIAMAGTAVVMAVALGGCANMWPFGNDAGAASHQDNMAPVQQDYAAPPAQPSGACLGGLDGSTPVDCPPAETAAPTEETAPAQPQ